MKTLPLKEKQEARQLVALLLCKLSGYACVPGQLQVASVLSEAGDVEGGTVAAAFLSEVALLLHVV